MNNLKAARISKRLTQRQVSELASINQSYYSELERGVNKPNAETRKKFESIFGKIDWIDTCGLDKIIESKTNRSNFYLLDSVPSKDVYYNCEIILRRLIVEFHKIRSTSERNSIIELINKYII